MPHPFFGAKDVCYIEKKVAKKKVVLGQASLYSYCTYIGIAVFIRENLPDDFIPPPPQAITACGDVNDVDHGDLNGTPST